ncbi:MAG: hypothetical protein JNK16_04525 [Phycisphaerales bacterium]|nr:hypothetical protein [Phycisphaerales bacterium]
MLPGPGRAGKVGYERLLTGVRGFVELQPIGEEAKFLPENVFTAAPTKGIVAGGFNLGSPDIEITIDDLRKYAKVPINFEVKKLPGR